jgi:hypothetical protein
MSITEKKSALRDAGVKVRSNASNETIDELWEEHVATLGSDDEVETSEVSSFENPPAVAAPKAKPAGNEAFEAFLEANQDPWFGDKTPAVVEWARKNLSAEDFAARYDGRTLV